MSKPMVLSDYFSQSQNVPTTVEEWNTLETVLHSYIQKHLYTLRLTHWQGAEKEITEDVLYEAILRAIRYAQRAISSTTSPIHSFEAICKTIAKRYLLDLRRKDKRLVFSLDNTPSITEHQYTETSDDPAERVIEDIMLYSKMLQVSKIVKGFTPKLKEAMLIHLANLADFNDEQPSPLERAMWSVSIPLREYRQDVSRDPVLRSRHAALVCLGYKTLRQTIHCHTQQPDHAA